VTILIFSPSLPLPFGATDARWIHLMLSELARRGHDVTCVSCTPADDAMVIEAQHAADAAGFRLRHVPLTIDEPLIVRKARSLLRPMSEYVRVPALVATLDEELHRDPDVFHIEGLFSSWLARDDPRAIVCLQCLETIDWSGRTDLTRRERLTLWQMRRATRRLLGRSSRLIAPSSRLVSAAKSANPRLRAEVVPFAVDPALYEPVELTPEPVVGLIGSMNWHPSRAAAERLLTTLWPEIKRRVPNARLVVGGWNSRRYLGAYFPLAGAELMEEIEHPREFFSRIGLLLYAPPRGTGMKIKVLESMAYGIPVLTNAEGLEGIQFTEGVDAVRAHDDDEFVERAVELLLDPAWRSAIGRSGRALVERQCKPERVIDRLLASYELLLPDVT
jgi:polysaccharide biosynthesis protein PslH